MPGVSRSLIKRIKVNNASQADNSTQAQNASNAVNAQNATSASYALTASYALNGGGGGGGTPGGSNTQIQYNNSGSFGGVSVLTYDGTLLKATGSFTGSFIGLINTASYALFTPYIVTVGSRIYTDDTFITAGSKGYKHIPHNADIVKTRTIANTNGYIDVNIKRNGTTLGTISLSDQSSSLDTILSGWTTSLNEDDLIEFYVSQSSTYITDISIFIDIQAR